MEPKELSKSFLNVIEPGGYYILSRWLIQYFRSLEKAAIFSEIISKHNLFSQRNQLKNGNWFFLTYEHISKNLLISISKIRLYVQSLSKEGIIDTKMMGVPAKQYYKINYDKIIEIMKFINTNPSPIDFSRSRHGDSDRARDGDLKGATKIEANEIEANEISIKESLSKDKDIRVSGETLPPSDQTDLSPNDIVKSHRLLERTKDIKIPLEEERQTDRPPKENMGGRLKEKSIYKPKPISKENIKIIDFWIGSGLVKHRAKTKTYDNIAILLNKLKAGTMFNSLSRFEPFYDHKFSRDDIIETVKNFSLAALNPDYEPTNNFKDYMRTTGFADFIYNEFSESNENNIKSMFLQYYRNPPKLAKSNGRMIPDEHPKLTNQIKDFYTKKVLGVAPNEWGFQTENQFRKAAAGLDGFFQDLIKKNRWVSWDRHAVTGGSYENRVAEYLVDSIIHDVDGHTEKLTPGWLASDNTFEQRLPKYLFWQSVITE